VGSGKICGHRHARRVRIVIGPNCGSWRIRKENHIAGSVNKVILIGNLGADPEVRTLPSGGKVVNLRLATTESWRDRNSGERKERTEWHRVVIFNENIARVAEQYLKKGAKVYVEGQLQTRKWEDPQGQERYSTEVVLQNFNATLTMLDGRQGGEEGSFTPSAAPAAGSRGASESRRPSAPAFESGGTDDDIPF